MKTKFFLLLAISTASLFSKNEWASNELFKMVQKETGTTLGFDKIVGLYLDSDKKLDFFCPKPILDTASGSKIELIIALSMAKKVFKIDLNGAAFTFKTNSEKVILETSDYTKFGGFESDLLQDGSTNIQFDPIGIYFSFENGYPELNASQNLNFANEYFGKIIFPKILENTLIDVRVRKKYADTFFLTLAVFGNGREAISILSEKCKKREFEGLFLTPEGCIKRYERLLKTIEGNPKIFRFYKYLHSP